jgi:sugar O-acyltransferase (sialic acid O-acetyltransferase NeuD family)
MSGTRGKIFVFGASGHAKVVIDIIERQGIYDIAFLVDDDASLEGRSIYGYNVIGGKDILLEKSKEVEIAGGVVAIGSNAARMVVSSWVEKKGFSLVTAIHPDSHMARGVEIGGGSVVMAGTVINSDTKIGSDVIINTKASIDHDCVIGNDVHVAPGSTICGTVKIGSGTFIGAGATIIPNLVIGRNVTVGAGAAVIEDLPDGVTVVGVPARIVGR